MGDSWEELDDDDAELPPLAPPPKPVAPSFRPMPVTKPASQPITLSATPGSTVNADDRPLILVDFTALSDGKLHNKFDKASCNDADLKREWTRRIEDDYDKYANDRDLLAKGVVKSCGNSVWKDALSTLRDEYPGHFWAPCFPPPPK